jgi:hypothetical protein
VQNKPNWPLENHRRGYPIIPVFHHSTIPIRRPFVRNKANFTRGRVSGIRGQRPDIGAPLAPNRPNWPEPIMRNEANRRGVSSWKCQDRRGGGRGFELHTSHFTLGRRLFVRNKANSATARRRASALWERSYDQSDLQGAPKKQSQLQGSFKFEGCRGRPPCLPIRKAATGGRPYRRHTSHSAEGRSDCGCVAQPVG